MPWPLLESLGDDQRHELLQLSRRRSFARNEVVCHEGDPADSLHLVESGLLGVRVSLPSGDTAMVNVLAAGAHFGELALLRDDRHRTATITALTPSATLAIAASAFARLCDANPRVERTVAALLGHRVDELSHQVLELAYVGLDRRLYRRLHELCAGADGPVTVPLTQQQLAELTGGTRPTINQVLQRLADQGVLTIGRGRVEVHDPEALRARCGF